MVAISLILIVQKNFQLPTSQSLGLQFSECQKMAAIFLISIIWKIFQLLTPPKVWVSGFLSVNRNGISESAIMKKLKNGCHFFNIDCTEKFPIVDPPQSLGLQFSKCQQKQNIRVSHCEKIEKWLPFL